MMIRSTGKQFLINKCKMNVVSCRTVLNPFAPKLIEQAKNAHSNLLADSKNLFQIQHHTVLPKATQEYEARHAEYTAEKLSRHAPNGLAHTGSWRVFIGNVQNQYVHIWMYNDFDHLDQFLHEQLSDPAENRLNQCLHQRSNQICLSFSYFGIPRPRPKSSNQLEPNIFEMRSYSLRPGTLVEWANLWHKGVQYRPDARVLGLFSQIGQLYQVHHMWTYQNFQNRKQMRTEAWAKPGWSDNVEYTVPLVRKMESKILIPLNYSPIQ